MYAAVRLEAHRDCQRVVNGYHMRDTLPNRCAQLDGTNRSRASHFESDVIELKFTSLLVSKRYLVDTKIELVATRVKQSENMLIYLQAFFFAFVFAVYIFSFMFYNITGIKFALWFPKL